jgi:hypothetical protein
MTIDSATIDETTGIATVDFSLSDGEGVPLDLKGRATEGEVSVHFVAAWLDQDETTLARGRLEREKQWSEAVAVGRRSFVEEVQEKLGARVRYRRVDDVGDRLRARVRGRPRFVGMILGSGSTIYDHGHEHGIGSRGNESAQIHAPSRRR